MDNSVLYDSSMALIEIEAGNMVIIDARSSQEYEKEHIKNSISLPVYDLLKDDSPTNTAKIAGDAGIKRDTPIIIYDDAFGAVASRVGWTLERAGHETVYLLDRTWSNWKKLEFPTSTEEVKLKPVIYEPIIHDVIGADINDVETTQPGMISLQPKTVVIDNRERLNYLESHIPGAVNISYKALADKDVILRSPEELKRIFDNRGIDENSIIITYCGSAGTLSGLCYYALKSAGITNVKLYPNSFKEWKEKERPTVTQPDANYWDLSAE